VRSEVLEGQRFWGAFPEWGIVVLFVAGWGGRRVRKKAADEASRDPRLKGVLKKSWPFQKAALSG